MDSINTHIVLHQESSVIPLNLPDFVHYQKCLSFLNLLSSSPQTNRAFCGMIDLLSRRSGTSFTTGIVTIDHLNVDASALSDLCLDYPDLVFVTRSTTAGKADAETPGNTPPRAPPQHQTQPDDLDHFQHLSPPVPNSHQSHVHTEALPCSPKTDSEILLLARPLLVLDSLPHLQHDNSQAHVHADCSSSDLIMLPNMICTSANIELIHSISLNCTQPQTATSSCVSVTHQHGQTLDTSVTPHPLSVSTLPLPIATAGMSAAHFCYLASPDIDSLLVDESQTVALTMFGVRVANAIEYTRNRKLISLATYLGAIAFTMLGIVLLLLVTFQITASNVTYFIRVVMLILFPLTLYQMVQGSLRLVRSVVDEMLHSFDEWYMIYQCIGEVAIGIYLFHNDVQLILLFVIVPWGAINSSFGDAMSDQSRARTGGSMMIAAIVVGSVIMFCCLFSPLLANYTPVQISSLSSLRGHAVMVNPVAFLLERVSTLTAFFLRFLVKYYRNPNAAINMQLAYVRQDHP